MNSPTDSRFAPLAPPNAKRVRASIFTGSGTGQSIELRRAVALVGSRPGCKITLRHPGVSQVHCAIINTGEGVYVRDLISDSGTYLNGLRAECEKLSDGDVIRVGDWEIAVELRSPESNGSSVLNFEPAPTVLALQASDNGSLVKLRRAVSIIGRKAGADLIVHDRQVSRAHALVFLLNDQPVACDLLSENGMLINGEPNRFGVIHSGDTLRLGSSDVRVVIPSPTVASSNGSGAGVATGDTALRASSDQSDLIDIRASERKRE